MRRAPFLLLCVLAACGPRVGDFCESHDACKGIEFGYCSRAAICTRPCGQQSPTQPLGGTSQAEKTKCPSGSTCQTRGTRMICLPSCKERADCAAGLECVAGTCELVNPFTTVPGR